MKKGDLLFIRPRMGNGKGGVIMAYERSYQGDEDISHHGSPLYENFIVCRDLATGVEKCFGDLHYVWCDPLRRIEHLQETLAKIEHIAQFS